MEEDMTLIDEMMEDCVMMDRITVPDGEGGRENQWIDGAPVKVAITQDTSIRALIAQADSSKITYKLTTLKSNALQAGDVIKRVSDGLVLKVTDDPTMFPKVASDDLNKYCKCSAERTSLV